MIKGLLASQRHASDSINLTVGREGPGLLGAFGAEEKETAGAHGMALGAGQVGLGGDAEEEHEEVNELADEADGVGWGLGRGWLVWSHGRGLRAAE